VKKIFITSVAGLMLAVIPAVQANATQGNSNRGNSNTHNKITICHATGSSTNPYVEIKPNANGVINGHVGHQDGEDIIPPFNYNYHGTTKNFPGQNWDAQSQATYKNGCEPVSEETQTEGGHGGGQVLGENTSPNDQVIAPVGAVDAGNGSESISYISIAGLSAALASIAVGIRRLFA
jgi:hypothetical protein